MAYDGYCKPPATIGKISNFIKTYKKFILLLMKKVT